MLQVPEAGVEEPDALAEVVAGGRKVAAEAQVEHRVVVDELAVEQSASVERLPPAVTVQATAGSLCLRQAALC